MQDMKPLMDKMSAIKGAGLASQMTITMPQSPLAGMAGGANAPAAGSLKITMTSEAKSVTQEPLDDALFTIPADYKQAAPPAAAPGAGPGVGLGNLGL